jgi:hypothetical protein
MRFKLVAFVFVASCLPTMTAPLAAMAAPLAPQGNFTVVEGRAHIEQGAQGTYVRLERPGSDITGFIPFGNLGTFPGLYELEGRKVAIQGVVVLDGEAMIVLTDPDQLSVG